MHRIPALILVMALFLSCQSSDVQTEQPVTTTVSIADFNTEPEKYVGRTISVSGTVDHVCKHGGKKMFIFADDPNQRLKIETTDIVGPFAVELEGSDVAVEGVVLVQKVDAAYLDEWEAETLAKHADDAKVEHIEHAADAAKENIEHAGEATEEHAEHAEESAEGTDDHHSDLEGTLAQIASLREELVESGKEYIGFYSLECKSYEEKSN